MADMAATPLPEDGYVQIDGETHVLNYDTNILNLEENREASPGIDADDEHDLPTTSTGSVEEDADIELSPGGILDEETIGRGLSNLGRAADGTKQVYLHCTVPGFNLIDIAAISNYVELQKVEIPYNQLTDLSPLSNLPYLLILDASHNKLTTVLEFDPPKNLQEVDLSFNEIEEMAELSAHQSLKKLNLDNNKLTQIKGLQNCHRLTSLSLAHNKIAQIEGLQKLPIQYLNLCHNKLTRIENIETLKNIRVHVDITVTLYAKLGIQEVSADIRTRRLRWYGHVTPSTSCINMVLGLDIPKHKGRGRPRKSWLECIRADMRTCSPDGVDPQNRLAIEQINFSGNKIRSLSGLEDHCRLESLDLEDNEVIDIEEIKYVKELQMLRQLNLLRNPIQELPDYRLSILYQIQRLSVLDRHKVEVEEKVSSINMFRPPAEVIASRDHIMHVVYSFLQPSRVWDSTLPSIETPYPMLVLVGPQGSGKKDLAMKLVEEFSDYFGYGISHTTRKPHKEETAGKDYHFVTEEKFEMDIKMGQFIQTYQYNGQWYGLQMESIESVAREGLACVVHMELEGVLTLKNTYFEPRYVLVMPLNEECHEKRLRDRGIYSEKQIEHTLHRADMYKTHNQEHPGFFDMMINGDDIQEAYKRLRRLVMDYLGIGMNTGMDSEADGNMTDFQRENTDQNITQMGTRTWSKPSMSETMSQTYSRSRAVQSPIISGRGIVEEQSLRRRQSAAKEAVSGNPPPLLEQLLTSYPKTAPQSVEGQMGLGQLPSTEMTDAQRSFSAPAVKPQRPGSSDSSTDRSGASSSLTGLTSASDIQRARSPDNRVGQAQTAPAAIGPTLPTEMVNPIELLSDSGKEPRPPSNPKPSSNTRPGSNKHRVLPPISPSPKELPRPIELA